MTQPAQDQDDVLSWLQRWYRSQCDGDWEHTYGVRVDTLDNPGWTLHVDLKDTELEYQPFAATQHERAQDDWIDCRVEALQFRGAGGAANLSELIVCFKRWAESVLNDESLRCRVCGLFQHERPWGDDGRSPTFAICSCCRVEFGYEDCTCASTVEYRRAWLAAGGAWCDESTRPVTWDRDAQLARIPSAFLRTEDLR